MISSYTPIERVYDYVSCSRCFSLVNVNQRSFSVEVFLAFAQSMYIFLCDAPCSIRFGVAKDVSLADFVSISTEHVFLLLIKHAFRGRVIIFHTNALLPKLLTPREVKGLKTKLSSCLVNLEKEEIIIISFSLLSFNSIILNSNKKSSFCG